MGLCCGRCCGDCGGTRHRPVEYSGAAVLATATAPAWQDEQGRRMLALPHHECLPWKLSNGKSITVRGRVPERPFRWKVELLNGGLGDDIALHFNVRHDLGYVVRNSRLSGSWGAEERCSGPAMPFTPGCHFELTIFCANNTFKIAVDGRHVVSYGARSPLSRASTLHCSGTVQLEAIAYGDVREYPPRPAPTLAIDANQGGYRRDDPEFPCGLPEPIQDGGEIRLTGRVKMLPFAFNVDLCHGSQLFPDHEVLFHFNPRFQVRNDFNVVVLNSRAAGWGKEIRPEGCFPFQAGRHFELRFVCQPGSWEVFVDGVRLLKFPHRMSKAALDALHVSGDVIIESVVFQPNSRDLIQF